MSDIAIDMVKTIRERLSEIVTDIDRMEDALRNAPTGAIEEVELQKEALDGLPWKPYKSGKGSWIFSNLENLTAKKLREALTAPQRTIIDPEQNQVEILNKTLRQVIIKELQSHAN